MKPSILIVMLDFLVCSLLLFVAGSPGSPAARPAPSGAVHDAFSAAALEQQQQEWNREYERTRLVAQLDRESAMRQQFETRLAATTAARTESEAQLGIFD